MNEKIMLYTDDISRAAWMRLHNIDMTPVQKDGKILFETVKTDKSITCFNFYSPRVRVDAGNFADHLQDLRAKALSVRKEDKG
jgi:hypothetical protein